ncbi:MAG: hypothetical protein EHM13_15650 [Acidobacteria bacterium]|nr:MAG: hypothetical protein EHM13_15650 [Acidobacteriota bacterium]
MADIDIQRKSSSWLWWVFGIIAVLLIIWAIASMWNAQPEPGVGGLLDPATLMAAITGSTPFV